MILLKVNFILEKPKTVDAPRSASSPSPVNFGVVSAVAIFVISSSIFSVTVLAKEEAQPPQLDKVPVTFARVSSSVLLAS